MFLLLLGTTLSVSVVICSIAALFFWQPVGKILKRIVEPSIAGAWTRYVTFAVYVTGILGGVRIYALENFVRPADKNFTPPILNQEYWILEVYRTIIGTLQSIAWILLVFFIVALLAYVIVRAFELRSVSRKKSSE